MFGAPNCRTCHEDLPQLCCLQFAPNSPLTCSSGSDTAHPRNTLEYHSYLLQNWSTAISGTCSGPIISDTPCLPAADLVNVFEVFLPQLLLYPNPTDPLNGEAAALLMREPEAYNQKVKGRGLFLPCQASGFR